MKSAKRSLVVFTVASCVALLLWAPLEAKRPGGGGGGEDPIANPAFVYIESDAVVTIASADGWSVRRLTGGTNGWSIKRSVPAWSPDGTMIAYVEDNDNDNSPYPLLYVMNADGSSPTRAYNFNNYPERYASLSWLPGGFIHFTYNYDACFLDLLDGSVQSLGLGLLYDYVGTTSVGPGVDPSQPGGRGLIAYSALETGVSQESDVYVAEVVSDGQGSLLLDSATITSLVRTGRQGFPVISPDGQQVAFYDDASGDGGRTLAVMDLVRDVDGIQLGMPTILRQGGLGEFRYSPTWSPDSQWIAFNWVNPNARGDAYEVAKIRRDGADFTNVTNGSRHENAPHWNPAWDPAQQ